MRLRSGFGEVALAVSRKKIPLTGVGHSHPGATGAGHPASNSARRWKTSGLCFANRHRFRRGCSQAVGQGRLFGGGLDDPGVGATTGSQGRGAAQARLQEPLAGVLVAGLQVRFRGPGWSQRKPEQPRVEWHEAKLGVFYRHEQAVRKACGQLVEKVIVSWPGEGLEPGRRPHWEALARGRGRAKAVPA